MPDVLASRCSESCCLSCMWMGSLSSCHGSLNRQTHQCAEPRKTQPTPFRAWSEASSQTAWRWEMEEAGLLPSLVPL